MSAGETIVALATPGGTGAVGLIRISGPEAGGVIGRASNRRGAFPDRRATLATVRTADGAVLDQVLVTRFEAPRSYTGEEVVEVSTHGGRLIVRRVLERLLECGARAADPGEFTERAFLNGKLDLTQAEAVMDLISAQSDLALRAAHEQLEGGIGRRTEALRQELIETVAQLEAWIDFPEEDIDPETGDALAQRMAGVGRSIDGLLATADQGRILREGLRTVICGRPNAGKSSLLNALLGQDRAIVSETAGTTRDTIEEMLVVEGVPLRVVDTAGLHAAGDSIEEEGIRRTLVEAARADLLLVVADATLPPGEALPEEMPEAPRRITILNKADLPEAPGWNLPDALRVSSIDGSGLDELRHRIREMADLGEADWGEQSVAINARHRDCLTRARAALTAAGNSLREGDDAEITALSLREALDFLGEVAGRVDTEEILGSIFSQFCIGK
ncbi:tRNA uridine-5-carboxymethylaminomethyl(34) synthesis GTPase MnmE [Haloferula sp. A504]|uniref:tRNA uridine-5-carboxymethylaminomethyl(34) synthesis GTPase MnmE n=1 Tax=Haloferula sp. A504 TaxID=3373601 RepID=UPI0031C3CAF7|nr:tRNA uridine-5-carboxymethylaminomethyl(34) synthesis GTPase MnmE [Verrucomicrobiaceae bacterium E54]